MSMLTNVSNSTGSVSSSPNFNNAGVVASQSYASRYTDEDIIEQILKVKASKEEILQALREVFPEKFI